MTRSHQLLAIVPAFLLGVVFEVFLGHRHDYVGHFAAGYGATLLFGVLCQRIWFTEKDYPKRPLVWLLPTVLFCIFLGVITELTVFRIAKFDEIDFFNQSLGAVLAGMILLAGVQDRPKEAEHISMEIFVAVVFLGVGAVYAVS